MVGDIYLARLNFNSNNRGWSIGVHYLETVDSSVPGRAFVLAETLRVHWQLAMRLILSADSHFESVQAWKIFGSEAIAGMAFVEPGVGLVAGETLPNDNCVYFDLQQGAQAAKFNGGVYMSGQVAENHTVNDWAPAYVSGSLQNVADGFEVPAIASGPFTGEWQACILSKALTPPATPFGTALPVTRGIVNSRVMSQRRRKQKALGYA